jgi:hypothetical protein
MKKTEKVYEVETKYCKKNKVWLCVYCHNPAGIRYEDSQHPGAVDSLHVCGCEGAEKNGVEFKN